MTNEGEPEDHWVAVSDLMGGLMMVFLLIAVIYMVQLEIESKKIKNVVVLYDRLKHQLYDDLHEEFKHDLPKWGAELDKNLTLRFYNTEVLFQRGEATINPAFKSILDDFFPRYVNIITLPKYRDDILEIRIEGHTSSDWSIQVNSHEAYINNMALSQARTRSTLAHLLNLDAVRGEHRWLTRHVTANGLSSSKPILNADSQEDSVRSRRVEFKVRTDAESRIAEILQGV